MLTKFQIKLWDEQWELPLSIESIFIERVFWYQKSKNESLKNTGFRYSRVRGKKLKMFCSKLWKKYRFDFFGAFGRSTAEILYRVQFEWRTSIQRKNTAEYSQPNGLLVVQPVVLWCRNRLYGTNRTVLYRWYPRKVWHNTGCILEYPTERALNIRS
jgi:hypothetical protein